MPYVRTIPYDEANGELKDVYDNMIKGRGNISNVQAVSSLRPHIMKTLMGHVASVMFSESGVSRAEREMVAAVVSATNKCQY
ncbi:MAG: carboxymuconolactone decarboxylase family protein [Chloroflexi bacterium]|nr:carboxymuconolactone decarboxylase family protein [Chloroflexota bacterium]